MDSSHSRSEEVFNRAKRYKESCVYLSSQHYRGAEKALRQHQLIGIPVVIIGTVVTTSIFATVNSSPSFGWKIAAGIVSLIGAILSALQTFLKPSDKAAEHKASAANYRALARRVDFFLLKHDRSPGFTGDPTAFDLALGELEKIADALNELAGQSPHITRPVNDQSDPERSERIP